MPNSNSTRAWSLLGAALLRPMNVVVPGVGLLVALGTEHWWAFPASLLPYAGLVVLSLKNRGFVREAMAGDRVDALGPAAEWESWIDALSKRPELIEPLIRIRASEERLLNELADAKGDTRDLLADAVARTREGAQTAFLLATAASQLDTRIRFDVGPRAEVMLLEAADRRKRAGATNDAATRALLTSSATSLDESAKFVGTLRTLQERSLAHLDSLATELENVSMRTTRLRMATTEGAQARVAAGEFRIDLSAAKETLQAYEETTSVGLDDAVASRKNHA